MPDSPRPLETPRDLSPETRDLVESLNNLAGVHQAMGSYAEARPLCERALAAVEEQLGSDHLEVAHQASRLGWVLQGMEQHEEANR